MPSPESRYIGCLKGETYILSGGYGCQGTNSTPSLEGRPESEWQGLEEHLCKVAELAGKFASVFGAGDWGYTAGLWHDLGKYSQEFQKRLHGGPRVDHSTAFNTVEL